MHLAIEHHIITFPRIILLCSVRAKLSRKYPPRAISFVCVGIVYSKPLSVGAAGGGISLCASKSSPLVGLPSALELSLWLDMLSFDVRGVYIEVCIWIVRIGDQF